jgi:hypothetical protein
VVETGWKVDLKMVETDWKLFHGGQEWLKLVMHD